MPPLNKYERLLAQREKVLLDIDNGPPFYISIKYKDWVKIKNYQLQSIDDMLNSLGFQFDKNTDHA